ncbi:hypothetical protein N7540_003655 [Penicillium herquei]|nr:hypothetical protein N7540_003655 [Penicillium herquei]
MFIYSVIVPIFPFSLVTRLNVTDDRVQHWVSVLLSVYGAALLTGAPIFGFFADQMKHRRSSFLIGLVALVGATLLLCLAPTLPVLIIGRLLQGVSASITWVVGLTLLADTANKETVAQSFGYVSAASSLGTIIGPVLGGIMYQRVGYYSVFGLCFAFLAFDIFLRFIIIEKKSAARWLEPPPASSFQLQSPRESLLTEIPAPAISRPGSKRLPAIFTLWKSKRMLAAFWGDFVTATVMTSFDTTLTMFVKRTFHWSSLPAGLTFLALLLPTFLGPVLGMAADKYGARWISAIGILIMIPPLILLRLVDHESLNQMVLLCALLILIGLGAAMALTGLYAEYSKICDEIDAENPGSLGNHGGYAQSYGISEIAWALAGLIGPLMSGAIYENYGWGTLGWVLSVFCFVTVIPTILFINH